MKLKLNFCAFQLSPKVIKDIHFHESLNITFSLLHRPYYMTRHCISTTTNVLFSCLVYKHNPQLEDPFNPSNQSQRGPAATQEREETKGDNVSHILKGYVICGWPEPKHAVTSTDHTEVSFWWKAHTLCPSPALPVSLQPYSYEYVFSDIQISTHILP